MSGQTFKLLSSILGSTPYHYCVFRNSLLLFFCFVLFLFVCLFVCLFVFYGKYVYKC